MPEKLRYLAIICICFIIFNKLFVHLYHGINKDSFRMASNDTNAPTPRWFVENRQEHLSFVRFGAKFLSVWSEDEGIHFPSVQAFPSRYLKTVKNPCWLQLANKKPGSAEFNVSLAFPSIARNSHVRKQEIPLKQLQIKGRPVEMKCLPYFMIIGQPKCATTDLFFRINQHRQVVPPLVKGPHWWTRKSYGSTTQLPVSLNTYADLFNSAAEKIWPSLLKDRWKTEESIVTGEASPSTLWDTSVLISECTRKLNETGCVEMLRSPRDLGKNGNCSCFDTLTWMLQIPERIKSLLPRVLLIVILRNPTDRLYSDFLYFNRSINKSKELFHEKVKKAIYVFQKCSAARSVEFCAYLAKPMLQMEVRLHLGLYSVYLKNWMQVFHRSQFRIIQFEDYVSRPKQVLKEVFSFLGLSAVNAHQEDKIWALSPLNRNPSAKKYGPMLPETRRILDQFYSPFNYQLSKLLRDSLFLWNG